MKKSVLTAIAVTLAAPALSTMMVQTAAFAKADCERYAYHPTFSGSGGAAEIRGDYYVFCSRSVPAATLYGRIKEDRTWMPDVVHKTQDNRFTGTMYKAIAKQTCQNNDMIFIEAQINGEAPAQSSRREQNC